jgi:hypothetical protein
MNDNNRAYKLQHPQARYFMYILSNATNEAQTPAKMISERSQFMAFHSDHAFDMRAGSVPFTNMISLRG